MTVKGRTSTRPKVRRYPRRGVGGSGGGYHCSRAVPESVSLTNSFGFSGTVRRETMRVGVRERVKRKLEGAYLINHNLK